jgi:CHASE2 domain-containing sensor protein
MAVRYRQPPRREWLPMLCGLLLIGVALALLAAGYIGWGWALLTPGLVLFLGVVVYRALTATADD